LSIYLLKKHRLTSGNQQLKINLLFTGKNLEKYDFKIYRLNMSYYERVQNAVNYIESNLYEPLDLLEVAQTAGCSLFHFHRIFQATAGYSLKEYIRKRRLAEAAKELRDTNKGILDIAFDFGYESQEAFTRAFQKETGRNPGEFRKTRASFMSFHAINFKTTKLIREKNKIKPEIIEKEDFIVIGPAIRINNENFGGFKRIPKFWKDCNEKNIYQYIPNRKNNNFCYGICMDFKGNEFTYMIGIEANSLEQIPEDMIGRKIPKAKYAVFTARGPCTQSIQDLTHYIFSDWIFNSGYTLTDAPELELYDDRFNDSDESETDIYMPIE
jgi:AraC family transcriptional regulator